MNYEDGDYETFCLANEEWRMENTFTTILSSLHTLQSNESNVLQNMISVIGNPPFLLHQAQEFPRYVLMNKYDAEEREFKKHVRCVPISEIPSNANMTSSHTIYKIKCEDNQSLRLKARIAPHGNEDSIKDSLQSDCCMCSPTVIRTMVTILSVRHWKLISGDVKTAFFKTGCATRGLYVIPLRESKGRR